MKRQVLLAVTAVALAGCASLMYTKPTEEETLAVIKSGFRDRGIAKVDRLDQSELQKICTATHNQPDKVARERATYRAERPDPTFLTHGPKTRREFLNLQAWGT